MPHTLSPSSINLMEDCPRCFWLEKHKVWKRPAAIFPSLPSGMDKILKEHFDRFMEMGKLPPELKSIGKGVKLFDDKKLLEEWRNWRKGLRWEDDKGNVLGGAIDNLLVKNSKIIVIDYKTRGFDLKADTHEHYQSQIDIYNFLLNKMGYKTESYTYLIFYVPERVDEKGLVIFTKMLVKMKVDTKHAEKMFKDAIKLLEGECPKEKCGWCENVK